MSDDTTTVIVIPTAHWDILEETLGMDSESNSIDLEIREQIKEALDELTQASNPEHQLDILPASTITTDTNALPDYNGACTAQEVINALLGDVKDLLDSIEWVESDRNGLDTILIDRQVAEDFKAMYGGAFGDEECVVCKENTFCEEEERCLSCGSGMNLWSEE
tara:strand:+ start:77 stop:568 length:492 start_codon:yes stop_codon:yes gene_type:complete